MFQSWKAEFLDTDAAVARGWRAGGGGWAAAPAAADCGVRVRAANPHPEGRLCTGVARGAPRQPIGTHHCRCRRWHHGWRWWRRCDVQKLAAIRAGPVCLTIAMQKFAVLAVAYGARGVVGGVACDGLVLEITRCDFVVFITGCCLGIQTEVAARSALAD